MLLGVNKKLFACYLEAATKYKKGCLYFSVWQRQIVWPFERESSLVLSWIWENNLSWTTGGSNPLEHLLEQSVKTWAA